MTQSLSKLFGKNRNRLGLADYVTRMINATTNADVKRTIDRYDITLYDIKKTWKELDPFDRMTFLEWKEYYFEDYPNAKDYLADKHEHYNDLWLKFKNLCNPPYLVSTYKSVKGNARKEDHLIREHIRNLKRNQKHNT
jgi:hypothetical protein